MVLLLQLRHYLNSTLQIHSKREVYARVADPNTAGCFGGPGSGFQNLVGSLLMLCVQEVVSNFHIYKLPHKMGNYFLDTFFGHTVGLKLN